ncbi:ribosomal L7Ae/L30e/S12e/Gadd45 family protein [Eubacteriales bacterium OttesenSCG-928-A19]|nr:ribosomal L7Ae/L30e/S12e/Gadd45 family protein [Eubacteriales bacterium OttesenSCG-928-A19]
MQEALKDAKRRVVGARQVLRAVSAGSLAHAYIARDADPFITRPVMDACEKAGVPFTEVDTMTLLGQSAGIDVKASVAGVLKESHT